MEKAVKHLVLNNSKIYKIMHLFTDLNEFQCYAFVKKHTKKKETYFMKKKNNTYHAMEMNALWRRLIEAKYSSDAAWACRSKIYNTQLLQLFHET